MSLSVAIIARDEAANLGACIQALAFAQEIVVVEFASVDNTADVARAHGAVVVHSEDWPGFGLQKNRALDCCSKEWVLSVDADERVCAPLAREIESMMAAYPQGGVAFEIPRLTQFCGVWIRHCGWTPDYVLRLFQRGEARFSNDLVHEKLLLANVHTKVLRLKTPLLHYSYPTPAHYWKKLQRYSQDWAAQKHAEGKKTTIWRAALSAITAFFRSYLFRLGFLDGSMGFAVCTMQAQAAFGKYFELVCLNQQDEQPDPFKHP